MRRSWPAARLVGVDVNSPATFPKLALVHCPSCDGQAKVRPHNGGLRLSCFDCGHSAAAVPPRRHYERRPNMSLSAYDSSTPPFGAPLWLETECCGGKRLWALNEQHLDYLAAYIEEKQREREFPSPAGDRQLASKLPKWMKLAKNREEVLRSIERLRRRL